MAGMGGKGGLLRCGGPARLRFRSRVLVCLCGGEGRSAARRCSSKGGCGGRARCRYYAVDPGDAEYLGKPVYKKVQTDGSLCTPGLASKGSQRLRWLSRCWVFSSFGVPPSLDGPYCNPADTPQPPHAGWKQLESCGTAPYPTVTML